MEDSFARLICSATSDHSVPDGNWYFPSHEDPSPESNSHLFHQLDYDNSYSSDRDLHSYTNDNIVADTPKANYSSNCPRLSAEEDENDPFSVRCRIPVPNIMPMSRYHMWLETSFMCRRNERERQRVRNVNDGFSRLRNHLPRTANMRRRQSKVETLQHAIKYIKQLQDLLKEKKENDGSNQ